MQNYEHLTHGMASILMQYTRGYTKSVVFEAQKDKLPALQVKFEDNFGIGLPAWKRHQRKGKGLPNGWACSMPMPGHSGRVYVVLLGAFESGSLSALHETSPWRSEKWQEKLVVGDYMIAVDQRDRRDFTTTWKLTPKCLSGLESYWRSQAEKGVHLVVPEIERAVAFYPMFGGIRRQLRRLIRGYSKLYKAKTKKDWPGPDPEKLPAMVGFRGPKKTETVEEKTT